MDPRELAQENEALSMSRFMNLPHHQSTSPRTDQICHPHHRSYRMPLTCILSTALLEATHRAQACNAARVLAGLPHLSDTFVSDPRQHFSIGQSVLAQILQVSRTYSTELGMG